MFKSKSLEGILGAFTKVQQDLRDFVTRTEYEVASHLEEVAFHTDKAEAKNGEIARANSVMENISNLLK